MASVLAQGQSRDSASGGQESSPGRSQVSLRYRRTLPVAGGLYLRLLQITNDFPPSVGGIENIVYSLASRWSSDEIFVLTRWMQGCEEFDRELPFEVERLPVGTLLPDRALLRTVRRIVEENQVDVIHFATPLPLGLIGPALRQSHGVPYATSIMGADFVLTASLPGARAAARYVLEQSSLIIPLSGYLARQAASLLTDESRIEVIPPGVDTNLFSPRAVPILARQGMPVIVFASRLVERKGATTLIRAMPSVKAALPGAHALIIGGGPKRYVARLRSVAANLRVLEAITFAGPQPWDRLPGFYTSGDLLAVPTRERFGGIETEGFGMVYLEAAACGLPVVAGRSGGVEDAVKPGETGYLVDGADPDATAEAIIRLGEDPANAEQMGRRGRDWMTEEFEWPAIAARFEEALRKVV